MENSAIAEFKQGINLLRNGHSSEAIECLRHAAELEQHNPYYISFLGVSVARATRKTGMAVELCETALRLKREEPQLYLNLAEVYVSADRREEAIETLDLALRRLGNNPRIKRERDSFGNRGGQVLSFLPRGHFLNRTLGQLRHKTLGHLRGKP
jgi:Flp pilus assembly protein TadD